MAHSREWYPLVALLFATASLCTCSTSGIAERDEAPRFVRCTDDASCPTGFECRSDICFSRVDGAAATGHVCDVVDDCPSGLECRDGICVAPMVGCQADYECGYRDRCTRGYCESPTPDSPCRQDADCPGGDCTGGVCR